MKIPWQVFAFLALSVTVWGLSVWSYNRGVTDTMALPVHSDTTSHRDTVLIHDTVPVSIPGKPVVDSASIKLLAHIVDSLGYDVDKWKRKFKEVAMPYEIKRPLTVSDSVPIVKLDCDMSFTVRPLFQDVTAFRLKNVRASYPSTTVTDTRFVPQVRNFADIFLRGSILGEWRNAFLQSNAGLIEPGIVFHISNCDLQLVPMGIVAMNRSGELMHSISLQWNITQ